MENFFKLLIVLIVFIFSIYGCRTRDGYYLVNHCYEGATMAGCREWIHESDMTEQEKWNAMSIPERMIHSAKQKKKNDAIKAILVDEEIKRAMEQADTECPGSPLKTKTSSIPSSWHNCEGTFILTDKRFEGDKYVGEWKDGKPDGQGTFYFLADGHKTWRGDKYVGEFKNGLLHGQGTYYHLADNQWKGDKYVGQYKDDKRSKGAYIWANGNKYVGEFKDNKSNGRGTYFLNSLLILGSSLIHSLIL